MRPFLFARSFESASQVDSIREALGMPMTVVRLAVELETIEERLGVVPT